MQDQLCKVKICHSYVWVAIMLVVGTSQIAFGTDFPYGNIPRIAKALHECGFTAAELQAIGRDNALRVLPGRS